MVAITLEIGAEPKTLRSCSYCDIRQWESGSSRIHLDGILGQLSQSSNPS